MASKCHRIDFVSLCLTWTDPTAVKGKVSFELSFRHLSKLLLFKMVDKEVLTDKQNESGYFMYFALNVRAPRETT